MSKILAIDLLQFFEKVDDYAYALLHLKLLRGSDYRFLLTKLFLAGDISVCCFSKDS